MSERANKKQCMDVAQFSFIIFCDWIFSNEPPRIEDSDLNTENHNLMQPLGAKALPKIEQGHYPLYGIR